MGYRKYPKKMLNCVVLTGKRKGCRDNDKLRYNENKSNEVSGAESLKATSGENNEDVVCGTHSFYYIK